MPINLKPRAPLPPFTFSPSPPAPSISHTADAPKPPTDLFPERDMVIFGSMPLASRWAAGRRLIRCQKCERPCPESNWENHQRNCKIILEGPPQIANKRATSGKSIKSSESKKRRASEDSDDGPSRKKPPKQPTDRNPNLPSAPTKTGEESGKPVKLKKNEIKRLKKERERLEKKVIKDKEKAETAERKRMRVSGPINLDKQCGVINDKGHPCARSLTCKTHTVGAKRSVQGRTRGYDELYLEWQRANNPKFKEPTKGQVGTGTTKKTTTPGGIGSGNKGLKGRGEDDDSGGRIMGENEMRELVNFARVAGDRCRLTVHTIGTNNPRPKIKLGGGKPKQRLGRSLCGGGVGSLWGSSGSLGFSGVGEALIQSLAARPSRVEPIRLTIPAGSAPTAMAIQPSAALKKPRPTGLAMPGPNPMAMQQQQQQQVGKGFVPIQGQGQGQNFNPQAMIAAAAQAAAAVTAGMVNLQNGYPVQGGIGGPVGPGGQTQQQMAILHQYQQGLAQQQGMMQAQQQQQQQKGQMGGYGMSG